MSVYVCGRIYSALGHISVRIILDFSFFDELGCILRYVGRYGSIAFDVKITEEFQVGIGFFLSSLLHEETCLSHCCEQALSSEQLSHSILSVQNL